jgi:hypothetical protein
MEEVFTLPSCFFFGMVAPLNLEELDRLATCDMILLIHDFDRVLGIGGRSSLYATFPNVSSMGKGPM